jgi:hypothetical protein
VSRCSPLAQVLLHIVAKMAPILSFIVGSLLAVRALADPFEKLFSTPEGMSLDA